MSKNMLATMLIKSIAVFTIAVLSDSCNANVYEMVSSIRGGDSVWKVVSTSDRTDTDLDPGIYLRGPDQTWDQVLAKGHILGTEHSSGIFQMELGDFSNQLEIIAVVDGSLQIMNINSSLSNPDSFINIGSASHPVIDSIINQNKSIEIPKIKSLDDLSLHMLPISAKNDHSQDVLFSVRTEQSQYTDQTGITFVCRISNKNQGVRLNNPCYLLDHIFKPALKLKQLHYDGKYLSLNAIDKATKYKKNLSFPQKKWVKQVENDIKVNNYHRVPLMDASNGSIESPTEPMISKKIELTPIKGRYAYSFVAEAKYPMDGKPPKFALKRTNNALLFSTFGTLELTKKVKDQETKPLIASDSSSLLAYIEKELQLFRLAGYDRSIYTSKIPRSNEGKVPLEFSFWVLPPNEKDQTILILSEKYQSKNITEVFLFKEKRKSLYFETSLKINNEFYTQEDFKVRFGANVNSNINLFDNSTPPCSTQAEYIRKHDITKPYLDLLLSLENKTKKTVFRQAKKSVEICQGVTYNYYNTEAKPNTFDGIYLTESKADLHHVGQLLNPFKRKFMTSSMPVSIGEPINNNASMPDIGPENIIGSDHVETRIGTINLTVLAMDPDFNNGEENFEFVIVANPENKSLSPKIFQFRVSAPISYLEGYKTISSETPDHPFSGGLIAGRLNKESNLDIFGFEISIVIDEQGNFDISAAASNKSDPSDSNQDLMDLASFEQLTKRVGSYFVKDTLTSKAKVLLGERLFPKKDQCVPSQFNNLHPHIIASKKIYHSVYGSVEANIFAIDPTYQEGKNGFTLISEVKSKGLLPLYFAKEINYPFSDFTGAYIQDRSSYVNLENNLYFIFANSSEKSGYYAIHIALNPDAKTGNRLDLTKVRSFILNEDSDPSRDMLSQLLMSDQTGKLYWASIDVNRTHRLFSVTSLNTGSKVYPNQADLELFSLSNMSDIEAYKQGESSWLLRKHSYLKNKLYGYFDSLKDEDIGTLKNIIFNDLQDKLEQLADPKKEAVHSILTVDDQMKEYIQSSIAARWLNPSPENDQKWSHLNEKLALYFMNSKKSLDQYSVHQNYNHMSRIKNKKPVLLIEMAQILKKVRLNEGKIDQPYYIKVPTEQRISKSPIHTEGSPLSDFSMVKITPNLLYLISSEGSHLSREEFVHRGNPTISTLIVGSDSEWEELKSSLSIHEATTGLLKSFDYISLKIPSIKQRRSLLQSIINKRAELFNGIHYDPSQIISNIDDQDPGMIQDKVIDYAIARSHALANEKNENVFISFIKMIDEFRWQLNESLVPEDGSPLVFGKNLIESILCKIYNLPLNLRSLPKDDPLSVVADKSMPSKMNKAGYAGNFDIKMRVIRGILSQTDSGDQKTIPASFVLFGKKGSGKTFLFKTLTKLLGLKEYNFSDPDADNSNAQVFNVNLGNITSRLSGIKNGENIGVDALLMHFDTFLQSPKGSRGFILFDDAHLSSTDVRSEVFSKIRSLFEAKNGKYLGVPVRNLVLFMTFNPTEDMDKIRKISGSSKPTPMQQTLATFIGSDNKVDESFFNRWGDIINLDYFSTTAKSSELINKLNASSNSHFNIQGSFYTTSNRVIDQIVYKFPKLNARDFLSSAIKSLSDLIGKKDDQNPFYLILPTRNFDRNETISTSKNPSFSDVEEFVRNNFFVSSAYSELTGYVAFSDMVSNNLRTFIYQSLIESVSGHQRFSADPFLKQHKLLPAMNAITSHLKEHGQISPYLLNIDIAYLQRRLPIHNFDQIDQVLYKYSNNQTHRYFPSIFTAGGDDSKLLNMDYQDSFGITKHPSRSDLLFETSAKLTPIIQGLLLNLIHLNSKHATPLSTIDISQWINDLPGNEPQLNIELVSQFGDVLDTFQDRFITNMNYIENISPTNYGPISTYDSTRLFLYSLDKAISELPWDEITLFLIESLRTLAGDKSIANTPNSQFWLFYNNKSLIRPVARDPLLEMIKSALLDLNNWDESKLEKASQNFSKKVDQFFYNLNQDNEG